jgi:hypothetical protein
MIVGAASIKRQKKAKNKIFRLDAVIGFGLNAGFLTYPLYRIKAP